MTIFWPSTHPCSRSPCWSASSRDGLSEGDVTLRKPIRCTFPACCALTASGAMRKAPATAPTKVRRSTTGLPRRQLEVRQYYAPRQVRHFDDPPLSNKHQSTTAMERNALWPLLARTRPIDVNPI